MIQDPITALECLSIPVYPLSECQGYSSVCLMVPL